jgi:hypothetical protein
LEAEEIFARFFFMAFLNSSCYETPKNAMKKIEQNQARNGGGETEEKKGRVFCDEPRWTFSKKCCFFQMFLNSPCYETLKKRLKNKSLTTRLKRLDSGCGCGGAG